MKLTKRKDGRFQRKITLPGGKTKYFYSSESTERKAEKDIELQIIEYDRSQYVSSHNFKIVAEKFLEYKQSDVENSTYLTYKYSLQYLSDLYEYNIEDITPSMLKKSFEKMVRKKYSRSALGKAKTTFGLVMNYAIVEMDLPITNFTKDVKLPKTAPSPKVHAPEDKVIEKIIKSAETVNFGMCAMILLCTGMRRGELVALQKKDINFEKGEIHIWRAVKYVHNQAHLKPIPKTISGVRDVPILDILNAPLQRHCSSLKSTDFVFGEAKPLSETAIKKRWKKYCAECDIKIHMHQLRHAYAKLLYRAGVDAKTAQGLLGHANINITMDIYTDFSEEMNVKSASKVNSLMSDLFAI